MVTKTKEKKSTIKSKEELSVLLPTTDYDPLDLEGSVELIIPEGLTKDLKTELRNLVGISRQEVRVLVDNYYQVQNRRIALQGQIRALKQASDDANTDSYCKLLDWQLQGQMIQEKGIKDALESIAMAHEVGRWLLSIKGIGPVFAAGMLAYFDIERCNAATQFISYAGQNDNNRPWLGTEGSKKLIEEVVGNSKEITNEHLQTLAIKSGWKYSYLKEAATKTSKRGKETISKTELIKAMAKVPYNKELKKMIFLIEESFVKVANRGSLYGQLIQQRKAIENQLNDSGHYADQAAKILATKNIGKDTDAYKAYSVGKLPKAHIQRRACRWAAKIFIVHVFEEMYRVHYGKAPEPFYVFSHMGHKDYIEPEVPYTR